MGTGTRSTSRSSWPPVLMVVGLLVLGVAGLRLFGADDGDAASAVDEGPLADCDVGGCKANADVRPARGYEVPSVVVDPGDPDHLVVADVNLVGGLCGWHVTFDGGEEWEDGVFELPTGFKNCQLDSAGFLSAGNIARGPSGTLYYVFSSARVDEAKTHLEGESVLVARSSDGGRSFAPATVAVPGGSTEVNYVRPSVNVVAGADGTDRVLVSFWGCDLVACARAHFAQSLDGGASFSPPVLVSVDDPGGTSPSAPMVDADGTVHVMFVRHSDDPSVDSQLALARSTDGGASFANTTIDSQPFLGRTYDAAELATSPDASTLYTVFSDNRQGRPDVFFRRSIDGGDTWDQAVLLNSLSEGGAFLPNVSVGPGGRIDVAFYQQTRENVNDVVWTHSNDGGDTFPRPLQLNDAFIDRDVGYSFEVGDSYGPGVASAPAAAFVVWSDSRLGNGLTDTQDTVLRRAPVPPAGPGT
ncbi:MAG: glycoside hydrolase [Actinomycetota bacterium]|nr:glycoside hydrolase [Actinomycetota bacterium]